jgi:hypothetical protein
LGCADSCLIQIKPRAFALALGLSWG